VKNLAITTKRRNYQKTPFAEYFNLLKDVDKSFKDTQEFGSILILTIVEEVGEMARAYLAEHGRKRLNIAAQKDETYEQELGDILVAIIRFARAKNINLHERILYTIEKIQKRQIDPKI
jgi:NTP pyrophosphatase (non-canonical NTP hydrolase)